MTESHIWFYFPWHLPLRVWLFILGRPFCLRSLLFSLSLLSRERDLQRLSLDRECSGLHLLERDDDLDLLLLGDLKHIILNLASQDNSMRCDYSFVTKSTEDKTSTINLSYASIVQCKAVFQSEQCVVHFRVLLYSAQNTKGKRIWLFISLDSTGSSSLTLPHHWFPTYKGTEVKLQPL